jgi:hypothetical protein
MRSEGLALMRAGITAQYADTTADAEPETGRAANRRAAYAAALSSRSSYAGRLSAPARLVPSQGRSDSVDSVEAAEMSFAV